MRRSVRSGGEGRREFRAKKSLGQHFLTSTKAVSDMVDASGTTANDIVLEIGPGKGILTGALLARGRKVVAIEKDERMIHILEERFGMELKRKRLALVHGDVLNPSLWQGVVRTRKLADRRYIVVANIPYYITGLLFRRFLEEGPQPKTLVFLVQKEVARSAVGSNGKESLLSLSIKAYGKPSVVRKVERKLFSPQPKVDSAILAITGISKDRFATKEDEERFFALIHAGFSAKRKMLAGNLARWLGRAKEDVEQALAAAGIPHNARAEDVPIDRWFALLGQI